MGLDLVSDTEATVQERTAQDSEGNTLAVGTRVHIADSLTDSVWEMGVYTYVENPRPFDFGTVDAVNEDGTVTVFWDAAGCACTAPLPNENPADLTVATKAEETAWYRGLATGYQQGEKENQYAIRQALGLPETPENNDN